LLQPGDAVSHVIGFGAASFVKHIPPMQVPGPW